MISLVESYIRKTEQDGVLFCFRGPMTLKLLESLEGSLKTTVEQQHQDVNTVLKVFSVFVEQTQNILQHSADRLPSPEAGSTGLGAGVVLIGREGEHFFVACGNTINNSDVPELEALLTKLRGMDKIQLKEYFRKQSKKTLTEGPPGAELGLIEMVRKSTDMIFGFSPKDADHSVFSIKITI